MKRGSYASIRERRFRAGLVVQQSTIIRQVVIVHHTDRCRSQSVRRFRDGAAVGPRATPHFRSFSRMPLGEHLNAG
jgi:hypothetical protein